MSRPKSKKVEEKKDQLLKQYPMNGGKVDGLFKSMDGQ